MSDSTATTTDTQSSWFDRLITRVADPSYDEDMAQQAENDKALQANRVRLLASGKLTTTQVATLNAQDLSTKDVASGNGQLFADEYQKEIAKDVSGVTNWVGATIWKAIPLWVWILGMIALLIYFRLYIAAGIKLFKK